MVRKGKFQNILSAKNGIACPQMALVAGATIGGYYDTNLVQVTTQPTWNKGRGGGGGGSKGWPETYA